MFLPAVLCAAIAACTTLPATVTDDLPVTQTGSTASPPPTPPPQTDVFTVESRSADVLWVLDNSCSMSCVVGCHGNLSEDVVDNFAWFLDELVGAGFDYHVGVITTDMVDTAQSGKLQHPGAEKFVSPDTLDPLGTFSEMAAVGLAGANEEAGLDAVYAALQTLPESSNFGFLREEAELDTIVLSNEDDTSGLDIDAFTAWYSKFRPEAELHSVVCLPSSTGDLCQSGLVTVGAAYLAATEATGGLAADISAPDWATVLPDLARRVTAPARRYVLSRVPVEGTITVEVESYYSTRELNADPDGCGSGEAGDWEYAAAGNMVILCAYTPPAGAEVTLTYQPGS